MSWIGTGVFGEVEQVDDDAIVTDFFCVLLPIWPQRSYYVHRHGDERVAAEISLHGRSVALGYARVTTWMAAWMITLPVVLAWARWGRLWPLAIALTAAASALQFVAGRLRADERDRRRLLRRVVGVGAPPELLPPPRVVEIRRALEGRWHESHVASWFEAIARGEASELLAALADYSGRPDLAREVRDRIVERAFN